MIIILVSNSKLILISICHFTDVGLCRQKNPIANTFYSIYRGPTQLAVQVKLVCLINTLTTWRIVNREMTDDHSHTSIRT